jgi:hypothetical protein
MPAVIDRNGEVVDISNYVKADDLRGKDATVTIEKVQSEKLALPGKKPNDCAVAYFVNKQKPLILNTTNLRTLRNKFGKRVADWHGKQIVLYPTTTKLRGNTVPCIRIREDNIGEHEQEGYTHGSENPPDSTGLTAAEKAAIEAREKEAGR